MINWPFNPAEYIGPLLHGRGLAQAVHQLNNATPGLSLLAIHLRSPTGLAQLAVSCIADIGIMELKCEKALSLLQELKAAVGEDQPSGIR